jgi:acetylornithine deacetylase/succinyl-diaminopimelate desuccinylase-like protein
LSALGEDPDDPAGAIARLRAADARLAVMFEPLLGVTFAPTRISASEKINVIPSKAVLKVDCRVPPGFGEDRAKRAIAEVLGPETDPDSPFEIEFTERIVGNRSPIETPLMDAISEWVSEHDPGARTAPTMLPGFTDSRHFREAFPDCVAYGFFPQRYQTLQETMALMHAADERIDARDLALATEFFRDLALRMLDPRSA